MQKQTAEKRSFSAENPTPPRLSKGAGKGGSYLFSGLKKVKGVSLPPPNNLGVQIGIVVKDIEKSISLFSGDFGLGPFRVLELDYPKERGTLHGKPAAFRIKIALAQMGPVTLELVQALEGETIYQEHLQTKGEGLHHLGFYVANLEAEVAKWTSQGIGILQSGRSEGGGGFAYMDTEGFSGVIFEFIQTS